MVLISAPFAWTARARHDRAARPSMSAVHAAQTRCSHPMCVSPGEPEIFAQRVRKRSAGLDAALSLNSVHLQQDLESVGQIVAPGLDRARAMVPAQWHISKMPAVVARSMEVGRRRHECRSHHC